MSIFYQNELVTMEAAAPIPAGAVVVLDNAGKAALAAADTTADAVVGVCHVGAAAGGGEVRHWAGRREGGVYIHRWVGVVLEWVGWLGR